MLKCKNTRKCKGPKLLFNKSIHTLPSKVTYSTAEFKRANLNPKLVTAAIGKPQFDGIQGHLGSKRNNKLLWRVLLDSGSDGDILFQRKNDKLKVPYTKRINPQFWHTSMGLFKTEKLAEFSLSFPEYAASKRIDLRPDIVEYDPDEYQPKFDLIIGTATMKELGIVLDFKSSGLQLTR